MGKSILTTGRIAERPYRLAVIDRNVYTVEELCYSIAQCASFLDEDFMDHELLVWLEESCGLAELAGQLRSLLRGRCAVEDFASVILLYVGYQSTAEIERIRASISSGKGMEPFQRRLSEAKFAASRGHITQAIRGFSTRRDSATPRRRTATARPGGSRGADRTASSIWRRCGFLFPKRSSGLMLRNTPRWRRSPASWRAPSQRRRENGETERPEGRASACKDTCGAGR